MTKVLYIEDIITPDNLGAYIAQQYQTWENSRAPKLAEWREIQQYVFATDTTMTTNSKLPWSNKTTIPKLCQIRDNLIANYMASLFPKRKWLSWEGDTPNDNDLEKRKAIEAYMAWVIDRSEFYDEVAKLVCDYVDYGNAIATVRWHDGRVATDEGEQKVGYVGPMVQRISPVDIVFNPAAPNFIMAPKIVRSMVTLGEVKDMIESMRDSPEEYEDAQALFEYMRNIRTAATTYQGSVQEKDAIFQIAGFRNFQEYLGSNYVEILTFYGDIYDFERDELLKNYVIKVVDRHKIFSKKPNVSYFGHAPIYHVGWRIRPDNLIAMGPLDNLVGMQYRIDHLENLKADLFDLTAFPPLKIKGTVDDFEWGPFEHIYVGDDGDVEILSPQVQALQADTEIAILEQKMEEMAGSPKEAMGFRSPGEKTAYEVQRLENAASRIFQNKIAQFERELLEPLLNAMLELARRRVNDQIIRVFDDEFKVAVFRQLTAQDITGNGRIRPMAARHFAEKAQQIQNLTTFYTSAAGTDPEVRMHFSSIQLARMFENLLDIEDYNIVEPYIRLTEQTEAQMMMNVQQERSLMEFGTPSGLTPEDSDEPFTEA